MQQEPVRFSPYSAIALDAPLRVQKTCTELVTMPFNQRTRSPPVTAIHPLSHMEGASGNSPQDVRSASICCAVYSLSVGDVTVNLGGEDVMTP